MKPLETSKCKKRGKIIAEPKELMRIKKDRGFKDVKVYFFAASAGILKTSPKISLLFSYGIISWTSNS
jgi:hypothetical protein